MPYTCFTEQAFFFYTCDLWSESPRPKSWRAEAGPPKKERERYTHTHTYPGESRQRDPVRACVCVCRRRRQKSAPHGPPLAEQQIDNKMVKLDPKCGPRSLCNELFVCLYNCGANISISYCYILPTHTHTHTHREREREREREERGERETHPSLIHTHHTHTRLETARGSWQTRSKTQLPIVAAV